MKLLALALIVLGVVALVYGGITYNAHEKTVLDMGEIKISTQEKKTVPLPPILGVIALVGGIALLVSQQRRS